MPNITFDSLDLVPDEFKAVAKSVEGSDRVTINVVPTAKIDEFRDKNIALSKERDTLLATIEPFKAIVGEDLEGFTKDLDNLRQTQQRVKDGELKETRAIEEALGKRTEELRKDYENRLQTVGKEGAAWRTKYEGLDGEFRKSLVAAAIKDAAMESDSGVDPRAVPELIMSAYGTFRADDQRRVIPFEGDAPIYGADGSTPMTPREWLVKMREMKPFFFKQTNGGGSGGETTRKVLGVDAKELAKMSASERLALANERNVRRG